MRPTSPSNRISRYYAPAEGTQVAGLTSYYPVANPTPAGRRRVAALPRGGRIAGTAASLLQLAVSALCVAGALSTWLGHPPEISPTTAIFLGGSVFGMVSLLQLYSSLTDATVDTTFTAYDDQKIA